MAFYCFLLFASNLCSMHLITSIFVYNICIQFLSQKRTQQFIFVICQVDKSTITIKLTKTKFVIGLFRSNDRSIQNKLFFKTYVFVIYSKNEKIITQKQK